MLHSLILGLICVCLTPAPGRAMALHSPDENVASEHQEVLRFLDQLAGSPASIDVVRSAKTISPPDAASGSDTRNDVALMTRDAGTVNATMAAMTILAKFASASVGSNSQESMAEQLRAYGGQLSGSGNSGLREQGNLMQQEAAAVALGDRDTAQATAILIQNLPRPDNPSGKSSPSDQLWTTLLQQMIQGLVKTAVSSFSQSAIAMIEPWLQSFAGPGGNTVSDMLSGLCGTALSALSGGAGKLPAIGSAPKSQAKLAAPMTAPQGASNIPLNPGSGTAAGGVLPPSGI